jgi:sugar (pentulose or hexulose) kinase
VLAVYESILFLLFYNYEYLCATNDKPLNLARICVSGGLSADEAYCQKIANLFRLPVEQYEESEATALGTAFLTFGCPTDWPQRDPARIYSGQDDIEFARRYQSWREAMQSRTEMDLDIDNSK